MRRPANNSAAPAAPARPGRRKKNRPPDVRLSVLLLAALFAAPAALGTALLTSDPPVERFPAAGSLQVGEARPGQPELGAMDAGPKVEKPTAEAAQEKPRGEGGVKRAEH